MKNQCGYFLSIVVFLLFNFSLIVHAGDQGQPLLTQQIDQGKILIAAESATALLSTGVSALSLVTTPVAQLGSCDAIYDAKCHRMDSSTGVPTCDCQWFYCSSDWQPGWVPNCQ